LKKIPVFMSIACFGLGLNSFHAKAQPQTPAFYEAASKISPEGALGQVVGQESITTPVSGAQAWRIAYISSDVTGRKTIVTGLVVQTHFSTPGAAAPLYVPWVGARVAGTSPANSCRRD
jgi:hypothetical protein